MSNTITVKCPRCGTSFKVILPEPGCLTCPMSSVFGCAAPSVVRCPKCGLEIDLYSVLPPY